MSDKRRFQFSIAWLLGITTAIALTIVVATQLRGTFAILAGVIVVPLILLFLILKAAAIAIDKQKLLHFWQATFAYLILIPLLSAPLSSVYFSESDVIGYAIFLGGGFMLSLVAFYRGNNATRLYVLPITLFYSFVAYHTLSGIVRNWSSVQEFWF